MTLSVKVYHSSKIKTLGALLRILQSTPSGNSVTLGEFMYADEYIEAPTTYGNSFSFTGGNIKTSELIEFGYFEKFLDVNCKDPYFDHSLNNLQPYAPSGTATELVRLVNSGNPYPEHSVIVKLSGVSGFKFNFKAYPNSNILINILAKIPEGSSLIAATSGTAYPVLNSDSLQGTGEYKEYSFLVEYKGSLVSEDFIAFYLSSPVERWDVANFFFYDMKDDPYGKYLKFVTNNKRIISRFVPNIGFICSNFKEHRNGPRQKISIVPYDYVGDVN